MLRRSFANFLKQQSAIDSGRLTVVCDLDETLCHVFAPSDATGWHNRPEVDPDFVIDYDNYKTQLSIYKRPYLDEFLKLLDKDYEPILISSGEKSYVELVLKYLDTDSIFRQVLWQDHCTYERANKYPQYEWLKDLTALRADISRMVIIDDDWQGLYKQPDNIIPIDKYEAWYDDTQLLDDIPNVLEQLKDLPDVRPWLRSKMMLKHVWAENGELFDLTPEDEEFAEFLNFYDLSNYGVLLKKYSQLYGIPTLISEF